MDNRDRIYDRIGEPYDRRRYRIQVDPDLGDEVILEGDHLIYRRAPYNRRGTFAETVIGDVARLNTSLPVTQVPVVTQYDTRMERQPDGYTRFMDYPYEDSALNYNFLGGRMEVPTDSENRPVVDLVRMGPTDWPDVPVDIKAGTQEGDRLSIRGSLAQRQFLKRHSSDRFRAEYWVAENADQGNLVLGRYYWDNFIERNARRPGGGPGFGDPNPDVII